MSLIQMIIIDTILLLFPLLVYLFYVAYNKNINKKLHCFSLDFAFLTSIYMVWGYGLIFERNFLIFDIPLILAYLKKRKFSIYLLSIILIVFRFSLGHYLPLLVLEYFIYYAIYQMLNKRKLSSFVWIYLLNKTIFVSINIFMLKEEIIRSYIILLIFYLLVYIIIFLLRKSEDIIKMHMNIKEFEKEKQVKESLFKITHEIKNPLAVCKSYLDMYDSKKPGHIKYISIIKEEINKILFLLQDFLTMTKIKISEDILDITMLLEEIIDHFEPILINKKIAFEFYIPEDEIFIFGDYNRLNQVFTNIITNSMEAVDKNGMIKIYTKLNAKEIIIFFEDDGIGISKENLAKIFEPFFTTKENGTGLGVALAFEIIKAHKGKIKYNSTLNKGTIVEIKLPLDLDLKYED